MLTSRESEVYELLMQGYSNYKVAEELKVKPITIRKHIQSILQKYKMKNVRELIANELKSAYRQIRMMQKTRVE